LLGAFLPYGVAEALGLSGICAVLFAGVMTDYYTYHHLSKQSQITTRHTVSTLAYISELFVFIYLGMSFFLETAHEFRAGYVIITLLLCFVARGISVFPLAFLLNMGRKHKLPLKHQAVLWYSGLRGPVAYALAVAGTAAGDEASKVIVTTTILIVAFTTLMLGGLAYPFLKWLKPPIMRSTTQTKTDTYDISNHWFNRLDRRFLRPYFGPKTRRNVNRPLTSMDEIEMDEKRKAEDPKLQLSDNAVGGIGANMEYITTNNNEEDAEAASDKGLNDMNQIQSDEDEHKGASKLSDVHLSVDPKDYSTARTGQPSFIENPERERDFSEMEQSDTWSAVNSMNQAVSTSNLDAPQRVVNSSNKAVTPPPNEQVPAEEDNDIMSSIPKEKEDGH